MIVGHMNLGADHAMLTAGQARRVSVELDGVDLGTTDTLEGVLDALLSPDDDWAAQVEAAMMPEAPR